MNLLTSTKKTRAVQPYSRSPRLLVENGYAQLYSKPNKFCLLSDDQN